MQGKKVWENKTKWVKWMRESTSIYEWFMHNAKNWNDLPCWRSKPNQVPWSVRIMWIWLCRFSLWLDRILISKVEVIDMEFLSCTVNCMGVTWSWVSVGRSLENKTSDGFRGDRPWDERACCHFCRISLAWSILIHFEKKQPLGGERRKRWTWLKILTSIYFSIVMKRTFDILVFLRNKSAPTVTSSHVFF